MSSSTLKPRIHSAKTGDTLSAGRRHSLSVSPNVRGLHERKLSPCRVFSKSDENVTRGRPGSGKVSSTVYEESKRGSTPSGDVNTRDGRESAKTDSRIEIHVMDENDAETDLDADLDAVRLAQRRSKGRSSSLPNGILRNHLKPMHSLMDISEDEDTSYERKGRRERRVSFSVPVNENGISETVKSAPSSQDLKGLSKLQVQVDRDPLPIGSSVFQQVMAEVGPPKDLAQEDNSPNASTKKNEKVKTLHITKKDKRRSNSKYNQ